MLSLSTLIFHGSGAYPDRDEKALTAHTHAFPVESLSQGTPFPFFKANSTEAQQLAVQFCNEGDRGQLLWPDTIHNGWPAWSAERAKILRLVAHILSLQAFYKYQKRCKDKKKQPTQALAPMESGTTHLRELSPESRILVGPSPPKGTRRRPAKPLGNSASNGNASTMTTDNGSQPDTHTLVSYIEHVESLHPTDAEKPLHDLTLKWLLRSTSEWPTSADPRLLTFMHINQFYDPDNQEDKKELALINLLRRDTEIEETPHHQQYTMLRDRVLDRVRFLANEMLTNKLLAYEDGKIHMVKAFRQVWRNRRDYWDKKRMDDTAHSTTTFKESDSYDTLNLYDDDEDDCVPAPLKKKSKSKAKKPINIPKSMNVKIPQRRNASDSATLNDYFPSYSSPHANKRVRIETSNAVPHENYVRHSAETGSEQVVAVEESTHGGTTDAETAEHIKFAEQVLRSPTMTDRLFTPQPTATPRPLSRPSSMTRDQPMTPTSSADVAEPLTAEGQATSPPSLPAKSANMASAPTTPGMPRIVAPKVHPSASTSLRNPCPKTISIPAPPTHTPSPAATHRRGQPEISLMLQNSNGTWDLDKKVHDSYLRVLDLSAFFALFSQRSGVPLVELDYLTFKLIFGDHPQQIEVIHKDSGEEEWMDLKAKIRKFFKFVWNGNPREREFDVWVEIGDTKEVIHDQDDDDLGGF